MPPLAIRAAPPRSAAAMLAAVAPLAALLLGCTPHSAMALLPEVKGPHEPTNAVDWILWKLGMKELDWHGEGHLTNATTSFGVMQVVTFGDPGNDVALALHGGLNMHWSHREFDELALELVSKYGLYIVLPNFHSIRATSPGTLGEADMITVMDELLAWSGKAYFTMLMGKAWGGAMAARYAVARPWHVERLTLMAPGPLRDELNNKSHEFKIETPTMVLWCSDDSSVTRTLMEKLQKSLAQPFHGYRQIKGGNVVLPEFHEEVHRFMKKSVPVPHAEL